MDFEKMMKIAGINHGEDKITIEDFFKSNKCITEENIDRLGFDLSIDSQTLHESIYELLSKTLNELDDEDEDESSDEDETEEAGETDETSLPVGKHNDMSDDEFDADQLAMGIDVEMEHTDDPEIAKAIAKDHLAELSDYYTRLADMVEDSDDDDDDDESEEGGDDLEDIGAESDIEDEM